MLEVVIPRALFAKIPAADRGVAAEATTSFGVSNSVTVAAAKKSRIAQARKGGHHHVNRPLIRWMSVEVVAVQAKLDLRIRQFHEAMTQARSSDLAAIELRASVAGNMYYASVDFSDGISDAELANTVSLCINNIACLKDHLKAWCEAHNKPFRGNTLIDSNREVGLIHDLWNRDKHYDLKRSRTGEFPEIRDISRMARSSTQDQKGSRVAMTLDPRTGKLKTYGDGKVELVIDADVVNAKGARIGGLLEIAERAVAAWEAELAAAGVVVPPR